MDITVCGKTYANVMGVKATDENGDTVVFSAVDGAGNYACTSIEIDNQTAVDFTLDIPGCGVYQGKKITFANPRTAEAGTIISTTAIYPVGGVAMVGLTYNSNLYEVVLVHVITHKTVIFRAAAQKVLHAGAAQV